MQLLTMIAALVVLTLRDATHNPAALQTCATETCYAVPRATEGGRAASKPVVAAAVDSKELKSGPERVRVRLRE